MTAAQLSRRVLWLLDVATLGALLATNEVVLWIVPVIAVAAAARAAGLRIRARWVLLALIVLVVGAALIAVTQFRFHPLLATAHGTILIHALLWLGPDEARDRVPRLALSFVNLILAAALTTDFYLLPVILAVAVLGSIYVAAAFLETRFIEVAPELVQAPIPRGFLRSMIVLSLAIFVISVALFPIIPRLNWRSAQDEALWASTGYRESVELAASNASPLRRSFRPALRITRLSDRAEDPLRALPGHLIKGQELELFDGQQWMPKASKRLARKAPWRSEESTGASGEYRSTGASGEYRVELQPWLRGQMFRPYGARVVTVNADETSYDYVLGALPGDARAAPYDLQLRVPGDVVSSEVEGLARRVFTGARTARDKVGALARFYRNGFEGTLEGQPGGGKDLITTFLLHTKKGRCELFATSAALLLRMSAVPTRLVAGYRASRSARKGVLLISEGDAHAWIEFWDPARGWTPFDPTPVMLLKADWLEAIREIYWDLDALWDRWVLNYRKPTSAAELAGQQSTTPLGAIAFRLPSLVREARSGEIGVGVGALLALVLAGWIFRRGARRLAWRARVPRRQRALRRECRRMATLLGALSPAATDPALKDLTTAVARAHGETAARAYREWEAAFLRRCYGGDAGAPDLDTLAGLRATVAVSFMTSKELS